MAKQLKSTDMKTLKMLFIGLLSIFTVSLNGFNDAAKIDIQVDIQQVEDLPKVSVKLSGLKGTTTLQLRNSDDLILLTESFNETHFGKVFDLSKLKDGRYEIQILTGNREIVQPIFKNEDQLTVKKNYRKMYFSPVVKVEGNQIDLSWFNGRISDMKLSINDNKGKTIYSEEIKNVIKVEKRFRLDQAEPGIYTFIINTPRKVYYESIKLK